MSNRIKLPLTILQLADFAQRHIHSLGVDSAEIRCAQEKGLSVTVRLGDVETLTHHLEQHFSVTIYDAHRVGSASSTDFSPEAIQQTIEKAATIARFANPDPYAGLPEIARLAYDYPDCQLSCPWDIAAADMITRALDCEKTACKDPRITNSEGVSVSTFFSDTLFANTLGFLGRYPITEHGISCSLIAKENAHMQRDYAYTVSRNPHCLKSYTDIAKEAVDRTVRRLNPRSLKTQSCAVIFEAPVAKSLLRSFVSAMSGGNLYRQSSFLLNALDQRIFPDFIEIYQQPHLPGAMGSAPFDAEGVATVDQSYVEKGYLRRYALGSYSARKLGLSSTGNSGGVYNLSISHTESSLQDLLKKMGRGLLITELMGQGVNITTGDYSRGASGFWVENGEIQYPVEEITVAGNLKDIFQSIVAVGNDTDTRGSIRTGSILVEKMMVAGQ